MLTSVETIYLELIRVEALLAKTYEISDLQSAQRAFTKYLIVASASYFESRVKEVILEFADLISNKHSGIKTLINEKILARNYHGLLDWKHKDPQIANFFKLFDIEWAEFFKHNPNLDLSESYRNFVFLGHLRNTIVHNNFADYSVSQTLQDIKKMHLSAEYFVENILTVLKTVAPTPWKKSA